MVRGALWTARRRWALVARLEVTDFDLVAQRRCVDLLLGEPVKALPWSGAAFSTIGPTPWPLSLSFWVLLLRTIARSATVARPFECGTELTRR